MVVAFFFLKKFLYQEKEVLLKWNLVVLVSVDSLHTNKRTRRDVELGHIILQHWKKRETARRLVTSPSQFIRWVVLQFYVVLVDVIYVVAQRMNTHKQAKVEWKGIKKEKKKGSQASQREWEAVAVNLWGWCLLTSLRLLGRTWMNYWFYHLSLFLSLHNCLSFYLPFSFIILNSLA